MADLHTIHRLTPGIKTRRALHSTRDQRAPDAVPGSRDFSTSGGVERRHAAGGDGCLRDQTGNASKSHSRRALMAPDAHGEAGVAPGPLTLNAGTAIREDAAAVARRMTTPAPADDWQDNLRTARGILVGVAIGLALWGAFIWAVFPE